MIVKQSDLVAETSSAAEERSDWRIAICQITALCIEKEIAQEIEDDNIIDEFAGSDKNRRIILI